MGKGKGNEEGERRRRVEKGGKEWKRGKGRGNGKILMENQWTVKSGCWTAQR